MRRVVGTTLVAASAILMALTRVPGPSWTVALSLLGALLFATAGIAGLFAAAGWLRPAAVVVGLLMLLLPATSGAWLVRLPDAVPPLMVLLACHALFDQHNDAAPLHGGKRGWSVALWALLPAASLILLVAAGAWFLVGTELPVGSLSELRGPVGPLIVALLVIPPLMVFVLARRAVGALRSAAPAPAADDRVEVAS